MGRVIARRQRFFKFLLYTFNTLVINFLMCIYATMFSYDFCRVIVYLLWKTFPNLLYIFICSRIIRRNTNASHCSPACVTLHVLINSIIQQFSREIGKDIFSIEVAAVHARSAGTVRTVRYVCHVKRAQGGGMSATGLLQLRHCVFTSMHDVT